jgi:hypothetical protein
MLKKNVRIHDTAYTSDKQKQDKVRRKNGSRDSAIPRTEV